MSKELEALNYLVKLAVVGNIEKPCEKIFDSEEIIFEALKRNEPMNVIYWTKKMIKLEDIEILRVTYRTLDNGARGVNIGWTTPEIRPIWQFGLYSLSRDKYDELCKSDELFNWCKQTIYQNEVKKQRERFTIRCPKCKSLVKYEDKFCHECGQKLDWGKENE